MEKIYAVLCLFLLLLIFYIPTIIFYKKTSKKVFKIRVSKYHNLDLIIIGLLLVVNIFMSTLELMSLFEVSNLFGKFYELLLAVFIAIFFIRHFFYTFLERYNGLRIFAFPFLLFLICIYEINCSYNSSFILESGFNSMTVQYLFIYCYIALSLIYLISAIVVPMVCYRKRKNLK